MAFFEIYKPGQGKYTRVTTFVTATVIVLVGAWLLSRQLSDLGTYLQFGLPTLMVVGVAALVFWLVNRPTSADFLIATEGEMKKVSWSSKKEIIGSTKVVIITTFILASLLWAVDLIFVLLFTHFKIMGS